MNLSAAEQMLIEQRVTNEAKSTLVAYLFWFFLGGLGAHRFYLGRPATALAIMACLILGIAIGRFGTPLLGVVAIWLIVDLFMIPLMIQRQKNEVREKLKQQLAISNQAAIDQFARLKA